MMEKNVSPRYDPSAPYDELPPLPPAQDIETKAILRQCVSATRALAELKGIGSIIPDQSILINSIPLQEARASSEIENIVTTQDQLYRAAMDEEKSSDPAAKEVIRYRTALRLGYERIKTERFSIDHILGICRNLRAKPDLIFRLS